MKRVKKKHTAKKTGMRGMGMKWRNGYAHFPDMVYTSTDLFIWSGRGGEWEETG